jgi:hypothetical protein
VEVRGRHLPVDDATPRRADDEDGVALRQERRFGSRRRRRAEQPGAPRVARLQTPGVQLAQERLATSLLHEPAQHRRGGVGGSTQRAGVRCTLGREDGQLGDLPTVGIAQRDAVVAAHRHDRRPARPDPEDLEARVERLQSPGQQRRDGHG